MRPYGLKVEAPAWCCFAFGPRARRASPDSFGQMRVTEPEAHWGGAARLRCRRRLQCFEMVIMLLAWRTSHPSQVRMDSNML